MNASVGSTTVGLPAARCLAYPAYRDSGVEWLGDVPEGWEMLSLGLITKSRCDGPFGSGLKSEHYTEGGVRVVRLQNIRFAWFDDRDRAFIHAEYYDSALGDHSVKSGDLLIAGLGDTTNPVGRACVAPDGLGTAMVKADCFRFRLNEQRAVPHFLALQLSAAALAAAGVEATGATRGRMNLSVTAARRVTLPPVPDQRAIATFLNRETAKLDTLVAKKERLLELLDEKRTALISRAVTKGLDPDVPTKGSGVEWLGEVPEGWKVGRVKAVVSFVTSGSRGWAEHYSDRGPVFIRIGNLSSSAIDLRLGDIQRVTPPAGAEGTRTQIRPGDVLVSITALIGAVAVVPDGFEEAYVNQHVALTRPMRSRIAPRWMAYALHAPVGQEQLQATLYGGTKDGLGLDDVRRVYIPLPPLPEQHVIAAYLDRETARIDALKAKIQKAIELLKEYRTALISAAVTGKIDVRREVAEPAA